MLATLAAHGNAPGIAAMPKPLGAFALCVWAVLCSSATATALKLRLRRLPLRALPGLQNGRYL